MDDGQLATDPGATTVRPLGLELSEGAARADVVVREELARPEATPLTAGETARLLARLPAEAPPAARATEGFALREASLPPPRTGRTITEPFPPDVDDATPARPSAAGIAAEAPAAPSPLEVARFAPDGEVAIAPGVSITFSKPMVALDSVAAAVTATPPARLSPQPAGEWRWMDTRTLLFVPSGERMPAATAYTVEVSATACAADGSGMADERAVTWAFATPAPRLVAHHPDPGPVRCDTPVVLAFDQAVDPAAILAHLEVRAGRHRIALRLATPDEIAADHGARRLAATHPAERTAIVVPADPILADERVTVELPEGTPSAEGLLTTPAAQGWTFRTPGPFRVRHHRIGWGRSGDGPELPWAIELSNPVDPTTVHASVVTIDPPVAHRVAGYGREITITHAARGATQYRVTLGAALRDQFGQALDHAEPMTFKIGRPRPRLSLAGGGHVILDPAGGSRLTVMSIGMERVRVRAFAVGPEDWPAYRDYQDGRWRKPRPELPGRRVLDAKLHVPGDRLGWTPLDVDLAPLLDGGLGQLAVVVGPDGRMTDEKRHLESSAWVQATRIGLDAFVDGRWLLAWATDLATGAPLAGVDLELGEARAATGEDGTARLPFTRQSSTLVARRGGDVAMLPNATSWHSAWRRSARVDAATWLLFDDRGLYRPGETVRVKGWVRRIGGGPSGDLLAAPAAMRTVAWQAFDGVLSEIAKGTAPVDALGGFDIALDLPATVNLGPASLSVADGHAIHTFTIAEFRRPEFEVTAVSDPGPVIAGDDAAVSVRAAYYAGGPLPGAAVEWDVHATPGTYTPPGWNRFTFGAFVPWWRPWAGDDDETDDARASLAVETDADGTHHLRIATAPGSAPRPWALTAEATVHDVNRQAWTASANLVVHPSSAYVGLRADRTFVAAGDAFEVESVVVDIDGRALPDHDISLRAERREHRQVRGEWLEQTVETMELRAVSGRDPVATSLKGLAGGRWRITARTADGAGRAHESTIEAWVAGEERPVRRGLEQEELVLVPDRRTYAPGDTAEILLVAPFAPAHGLLTVRRAGLLREEAFSVTGVSHTLRVPIEGGMTPNVHVAVALVGSAPRDEGVAGTDAPGATEAPGRPAFATGSVKLDVPPAARTLGVAVTPRDAGLRPGEATVLDIAVTAQNGSPVAGGAAVIVVDEAILAVAGYRTPDPMAVFYPERGEGVEETRSRRHVLLAALDELKLAASASASAADHEPGRVYKRSAGIDYAASPAMMMETPPRMHFARSMADAPPEPAPEPIRARTDFAALALFAAAVPVGDDGRASVEVKLPDNLTRYRVMVVATDGTRRFGLGEAAITARLPLMVRPSAPRFLSWGDRFELPVVVQNQGADAATVDVAVRPSNALLTEGAGRRLVVPAGDRVEVRFPAAADAVGEARFEVAATAGPDADAATVTLPVRTPATTEAFAVHGTLDEGAIAQPVRVPAGAVPSFGGLEVTTSSTAVAALTDAVLYLVAYPFECAEQLASRILGIAALRDVLAAFEADGLPAPAELEAAVGRDLATLRSMQNADGGFGFWRRGGDSWPYLGVHVAHAIARAQAKGYEVPAAMTDASLGYLRTIDGRFGRDYSADARTAIEAYAVHVRALLDDPDPAAARALVARYGRGGSTRQGAGELPVEAMAWLLPVLGADGGSRSEAAEIRRQLANRVTETPGAASVAARYVDGAHLLLASDRRADAVVLDALIADQPSSDLVPKLAAGLLAHRTAGRWGNTQENAFVLLALGRYFEAYEGVTPDFVARLWLGERYAGEQAFRGRSTDRRSLLVPMADLRPGDGTADGTARGTAEQELLLAKEGPGRCYYRFGLRYAPADLALEPLDRGFEVTRTYEAADDPTDVRRDDDGAWHIRAGARVRIRVAMTARSRRYHVALVDPLPAGFEAIDPSLATTAEDAATGGSDVRVIGAQGLGGPRRGSGQWWWRARPWYDHQNLRDDRVEAFSSLLWEGEHAYTYLARATTPGTFTAPPPRAEEMYTPETFGRGATDRVVIG